MNFAALSGGWLFRPPALPEAPDLDDFWGGYTNAAGASPTVFSVMGKPVSDA